MKLGVSYYGNRIPWRVREDLEEIRRIGCSYVVHTYSEEDLEFYRPAMTEIVRMTRGMGMEAWLDPWGVGQAFGGETYSALVAKDLSVRQTDSTGASLPIACPNQPGFREYLLRWIQSAAELRPDVLFWDEPHFMIYPEPDAGPAKLWACRCLACQQRFQKIHGHPMPERMTDPVRRFKEDSLVETIRFLCEATAAQGLRSSVCLLPITNSSTVNDWAKVAAIPSVQILGSDPYWRPRQSDVGPFVGRFARKIQELAARFGKEGMIWILNFQIPKGEEPTIRTAVEAAYAEGIRNFAAWSYYGAAPMQLKAEDPEAVWKTLAAVYGELKNR